jgi:Raf kinase inhibitor-like YbhB/YbcL family protein
MYEMRLGRVLVVAASIGAASANVGVAAATRHSMQLSSPAFSDGGRLPASATCTGTGTSPALQWSHVPRHTRELDLLVIDPDAPSGTVSHWVVYNIPPDSRGFPTGSIPAGAKQGVNAFGLRSYLPPCPQPPGSTHRYVFELFAARATLTFAQAPKDSEVRSALKGNVLAAATLTGEFAIGG